MPARAWSPTAAVAALGGAVADLVAPPRCLACRSRAAPPWCAPCRREVAVLGDGCVRCAAPRGTAHACWPADAPVSATVAVYDYRGPVSAAVVTAKLGGARSAWPRLAEPLARRVAARDPAVDVVTWVTTPPARVRRRGVDHAEVLARAVARAIDVPAVRLLDARADGADRDRYRARLRLPATHVLLVDDVLTTGTTAVRVADVLLEAGAGRVELAVLARAGTHPLGVADPRRDGPRRDGPRRDRRARPSQRQQRGRTSRLRSPAGHPPGPTGRDPERGPERGDAREERW
jgi:predicted amidophosphoribosyltransferase